MKEKISIVPIYIGSVPQAKITDYSDVFLDYFDTKNNFFIFTSNLTQWGKIYNSDEGEIFEYIEKLDKAMMLEIEKQDPIPYINYLKENKTSLSGKHVQNIQLHILDITNYDQTTKYIRYSQSNHVLNMDDSCVSYGSAIIYQQV